MFIIQIPLFLVIFLVTYSAFGLDGHETFSEFEFPVESNDKSDVILMLAVSFPVRNWIGVWKPSRMMIGHFLTIWIPYYSGSCITTVFTFYVRQFLKSNHLFSLTNDFLNKILNQPLSRDINVTPLPFHSIPHQKNTAFH